MLGGKIWACFSLLAKPIHVADQSAQAVAAVVIREPSGRAMGVSFCGVGAGDPSVLGPKFLKPDRVRSQVEHSRYLSRLIVCHSCAFDNRKLRHGTRSLRWGSVW